MYILNITEILGCLWFGLLMYDFRHASLFDYWTQYDYCSLGNFSMILLYATSLLIRLIFRNRCSQHFHLLCLTALFLLMSIGVKVDLSDLKYMTPNLLSFVFLCLMWYRFYLTKCPTTHNSKIVLFRRILHIAILTILGIQVLQYIIIFGITHLAPDILIAILLCLILMRHHNIFPYLYYIYATSIIGLSILISHYSCNINMYVYEIGGYYLIDYMISYSAINILLASWYIAINHICNNPNNSVKTKSNKFCTQ